MPIIYHVTTKEAWDQAITFNFYEADSLKDEGFIHCSEPHQVAGVLERYFAGKNNLVKLEIDTDLLHSRFVHEWSPSTQDTFPHIYGRINIDAVRAVTSL